MEKRAQRRTAANIKAHIVYDREMYSGTVKNLSEQGIYLQAKSRFPSKLRLKVSFHLKPKFTVLMHHDGTFKIHLKLRRLVRNGSCYGIGAEVQSPPEDYLKLVNSL